MIIGPCQSDDAPALADIFHASVHKVATRDYSCEQTMVWSPAKPKPESYLTRAKQRIVFVVEDEDDTKRLIGYGVKWVH